MNLHVQPGDSGNVPVCVTFATLAAEYQAAYDSAGDDAATEQEAQTLLRKSCLIAERMTMPDVSMNRSDEVVLAKIILAQADGAFGDKTVERLVRKLLNNIIARRCAVYRPAQASAGPKAVFLIKTFRR